MFFRNENSTIGELLQEKTELPPAPYYTYNGGPCLGGPGPRPRPQMWGQGALTASGGAQIGPRSAQTAIQAATEGPPLTQDGLQGSPTVQESFKTPPETLKTAPEGPSRPPQHASDKPKTFKSRKANLRMTFAFSPCRLRCAAETKLPNSPK